MLRKDEIPQPSQARNVSRHGLVGADASSTNPNLTNISSMALYGVRYGMLVVGSLDKVVDESYLIISGE